MRRPFYQLNYRTIGLPTGSRTPISGLEGRCIVQLCYREIWWSRPVLPRRHPDFQSGALLAELHDHMARVERFELPSALLESDVLPLNYTLINGERDGIRTHDDSYGGCSSAPSASWVPVHMKIE